MKCPYSVGSVMFGFFDPAEVWLDTTWVQPAAGRVLSGGAPGVTGGEKNVTLTTAQMAGHLHTVAYVNTTLKKLNGPYERWAATVSGSSNITMDATGGNQPHNNIMPYIVCGIWERIS